MGVIQTAITRGQFRKRPFPIREPKLAFQFCRVRVVIAGAATTTNLRAARQAATMWMHLHTGNPSMPAGITCFNASPI
jgi:hypothetical protein